MGLVAADLRQWQGVTSHLAERRRQYRDKIVGEDSGQFHYDRTRLIDAVSRESQRVVESYRKLDAARFERALDRVDEVSGDLRHAPTTARRTEAAPLARQRGHLIVAARAAKKPVGVCGEMASRPDVALGLVALGVGAYSAGIFHLFTHAFFKALLFLGAGSVIHAMHHEQDIRNMGQLRRYIPFTAAMMAIGTLALTGFPFTADYNGPQPEGFGRSQYSIRR